MNEISHSIGRGPVTMSSREIAELTGKRHDNVIRDIKSMFEALGLGLLSFEGTYLDTQGKPQRCFDLPKRETLILVSGYDVVLRAKVVDKVEELERRVADPAVALNDPAMLRHLLLENVEKVLSLEADLKEIQPLAAAYEHLTRADGTVCVTDAAKLFNQRPKDFFDWLKARRWIYRRAGNGHWIGYQDKIQSGYLDHRVDEVTRADGSVKITEQVRITAKGLAKLGESFVKEAA